MPGLQLLEQFHKCAHLRRDADLRKSDDEIVGKTAGLFEKRGQEQVQGPGRSRAKSVGKRLDADSDKRWKSRLARATRQKLGARHRVSIFLRVGPIAVAVFKIDPKILHRLALQLGDGALEDGIGKFARRQSQGSAE